MGGAYAQDPQGWKRPWVLWGGGLRLKEQKGPRRAPHPWSQRAGDLTWEPSRLPRLEWAGPTPCSPLPVREGPSHLPLQFSPWPPSYAPRTNAALGEVGTLEGLGPAWQLSRLPGLSGWGKRPPLLSCSFRRAPPTCLSSSPQSPGCPSCLASTSPPPCVPLFLPVHLGVPPVSLDIRVPQQQPAVALVVERR